MLIEAEGYVNYDIHTNISTAEGKVKLTQEKGVITADQLTYYGNEGLIKASGSVKASSNDGVIIEAGRLNFNKLTGIAEFNDHVKLTSEDGVTITADQLTYNNTSGLAIASGGVRIIQKQDVYRTEKLEYNLQTHQGSSGSTDCSLDSGGKKDIKLNGERMEIVNGVTKMKKTVFTRCLEPTAEYFITATSIEYDGKRVKLWNSIVFLYGIPVFYFPYLSFQVDSEGLPNLEPGYNQEDGFYLIYSFATPVENGHNWFFNGVYKTKDTSTYGVGLGIYKGDLSNRITINYNDPRKEENYWNVTDTVSYNMPLFYFVLDGSRDFNASEKTQYGLTFTRKYWDGPLGRWQAGILAREINIIDGPNKYCGVYNGFRLDYNPHRYMTFSLLQIEPLSISSGWDFESLLLSDYDYQFGSNWMYNIGIPVGKIYSFDMDGTYNSAHSSWINRKCRITRKTCCYRLSLGWDDIEKNISFDWGIRF